jgi:hypothetical protein
MRLQEAKAYLKAGIEHARNHHDWTALRNSVWRLSQALHELGRAEEILGRSAKGVHADVADLDVLVAQMAKP